MFSVLFVKNLIQFVCNIFGNMQTYVVARACQRGQKVRITVNLAHVRLVVLTEQYVNACKVQPERFARVNGNLRLRGGVVKFCTYAAVADVTAEVVLVVPQHCRRHFVANNVKTHVDAGMRADVLLH